MFLKDLIANKKLPAWFNSEFSFLICIFSTFASPLRLDYASRMETWLCVGSFHAQILPKYCYECCDICERLSVKFIGNTHLKQIYGLTNCSEKFFGRDNYVGRLAGFFAWHRVSEERSDKKIWVFWTNKFDLCLFKRLRSAHKVATSPIINCPYEVLIR